MSLKTLLSAPVGSPQYRQALVGAARALQEGEPDDLTASAAALLGHANGLLFSPSGPSADDWMLLCLVLRTLADVVRLVSRRQQDLTRIQAAPDAPADQETDRAATVLVAQFADVLCQLVVVDDSSSDAKQAPSRRRSLVVCSLSSEVRRTALSLLADADLCAALWPHLRPGALQDLCHATYALCYDDADTRLRRSAVLFATVLVVLLPQSGGVTLLQPELSDLLLAVEQGVCDPDAAVRQASIAALTRICVLPHLSEEYRRESSIQFFKQSLVRSLNFEHMRNDSDESVRGAALRLSAVVQSPVANFHFVGSASLDVSPRIRTLGFELLANSREIPSEVLTMTLRKEVVQEGKKLSDRDLDQLREAKRRRLAETFKPRASEPTRPMSVKAEEDLDDSAEMMRVKASELLQAGSAAGAFIYGLEDEFSEVRSAAVQCMRDLATAHAATSDFGSRSLDYLTDMFQDDISSVRIQAIDAVRAVAEVCRSLSDVQLLISTHMLEDGDADIRHAVHRLIEHATLVAHPSTLLELFSSLHRNSRRYPADLQSLVRCSAGLARRNSHLMTYVVEALLQRDPFFVSVNPEIRDARTQIVAAAVGSASEVNVTLAGILPTYMQTQTMPFLEHAQPGLFQRQSDSNHKQEMEKRFSWARKVLAGLRSGADAEHRSSSRASVLREIRLWRRTCPVAAALELHLLADDLAEAQRECHVRVVPRFVSLEEMRPSDRWVEGRLVSPSENSSDRPLEFSALFPFRVLVEFEASAGLLAADFRQLEFRISAALQNDELLPSPASVEVGPLVRGAGFTFSGHVTFFSNVWSAPAAVSIAIDVQRVHGGAAALGAPKTEQADGGHEELRSGSAKQPPTGATTAVGSGGWVRCCPQHVLWLLPLPSARSNI